MQSFVAVGMQLSDSDDLCKFKAQETIFRGVFTEFLVVKMNVTVGSWLGSDNIKLKLVVKGDNKVLCV